MSYIDMIEISRFLLVYNSCDFCKILSINGLGKAIKIKYHLAKQHWNYYCRVLDFLFITNFLLNLLLAKVCVHNIILYVWEKLCYLCKLYMSKMYSGIYLKGYWLCKLVQYASFTQIPQAVIHNQRHILLHNSCKYKQPGDTISTQVFTGRDSS